MTVPSLTLLSPNTQAILLLTAPLTVGRGIAQVKPLSLGEYKRLARALRQSGKQPADLLDGIEASLFAEAELEAARVEGLLARGFQLSQAVEKWQARAIWVLSRADAAYPPRFRKRLGEDAPPILYGCGDPAALDAGGLAVVGSRNVDEWLLRWTDDVARLAARAGCPVVSGGARGVDQAAMGGALEAGGRAAGVLADSLERAVVNRDYRDAIQRGCLVLVSPYDPGAAFQVGHAMQRNKLVYALSDAALVVNSDLKGGTWEGAVEQFDKRRFVPVFVRKEGAVPEGLLALERKGARPWPGPRTAEDLLDLLRAPQEPPREQGSLFVGEQPY